MHRSKHWKPILSWIMVALLLAASAPALAGGAAAKYTAEENAKGGFILVQNPGGGKQLTYAKDSGVTLLEAEEGGSTYAFKDLNRNGKLDPYEDWRLPNEERAKDLVEQLSVEEVGGLMMASYHFGMMGPISADLDASANIMGNTTRALLDKGVRAILNAASASPTAPQVEWSNAIQAYAEAKPFGIPVNMFSDPRSNAGASDGPYDGSKSSVAKWPGSLGFAATFDPQTVKLFGEYTAKEYRALGITTALSPQIDVGTEPRWVRFSGTYGESAQLVADITKAYTEGFQSTEGGEWGKDSVAAMVKHWPGDGSGEAGRESHSNAGKYAVYPGDNLAYHLEPFAAVMKGAKGSALAAAVMPSYSIGIAADGSPLGGDPDQLGSGVSPFKMVKTLREDMGFTGLVCTDWGVAGNFADNADGTATDQGGGMAWGTAHLDAGPRVWAGFKVGVDMYGGLDSLGAVMAAYKTACEEIGEEAAKTHFKQSAYRAVLLTLQLGLFEDPYLDPAASEAVVGNEEYTKAGFDAQLKSVVLLKNQGNVMQAAGSDKRTVYIPLVYSPEAAAMFGTTPASIAMAVDEAAAKEYFNVVTDELKAGADPAAPQPEDIVPRTDFTGVDFALVKVGSPENPGNQFTGSGFDMTVRNVPGDTLQQGMFGPSLLDYRADAPIDNGYIPRTLQYGPYTADPAVVRAKPIATDPVEEKAWVEAGQAAGMSRYYGGKSVTATNAWALELIRRVEKAVGDIPVVVAVAAQSPMVLSEFEADTEGIVLGFGISDRALLSVVSGQTEPSGLLPFQMPKDMATVEKQLEDVPFDMDCYVDAAGNTYDFAFGLNWAGAIQDARTAAYAPKK